MSFITRRQWAQFVKDESGNPDWRTIQDLEQLDTSSSDALALLTPQLNVDHGGTGNTNLTSGAVLIGQGLGPIAAFLTTANRSLWGAGVAGIDDDPGFVRTGDSGRYLFGVADNTVDKVQLVGGLALDAATLRPSAGDTVMSSTVAGGALVFNAGGGANGSGAQLSLAGAGAGGGTASLAGGTSLTANTGGVVLNIPTVGGAAGNGGAGSILGGDGAGAAGVGTSWTLTTGNGTLTNGVFTIRDNASTTSLIFAPATGVLTVPSITTTGGAAFHRTNTALTNSAAGNLGTLGNAPAVGNPTKWIGINDNGTLRQIPAW